MMKKIPAFINLEEWFKNLQVGDKVIVCGHMGEERQAEIVRIQKVTHTPYQSSAAYGATELTLSTHERFINGRREQSYLRPTPEFIQAKKDELEGNKPAPGDDENQN